MRRSSRIAVRISWVVSAVMAALAWRKILAAPKGDITRLFVATVAEPSGSRSSEPGSRRPSLGRAGGESDTARLPDMKATAERHSRDLLSRSRIAASRVPGGVGLNAQRGLQTVEADDGRGASAPSTGVLLTVLQVWRVLAVGRDPVYSLIRSKALPSVKIANLRRVRRSDLDAYLAVLEPVGLGLEA